MSPTPRRWSNLQPLSVFVCLFGLLKGCTVRPSSNSTIFLSTTGDFINSLLLSVCSLIAPALFILFLLASSATVHNGSLTLDLPCLQLPDTWFIEPTYSDCAFFFSFSVKGQLTVAQLLSTEPAVVAHFRAQLRGEGGRVLSWRF